MLPRPDQSISRINSFILISRLLHRIGSIRLHATTTIVLLDAVERLDQFVACHRSLLLFKQLHNQVLHPHRLLLGHLWRRHCGWGRVCLLDEVETLTLRDWIDRIVAEGLRSVVLWLSSLDRNLFDELSRRQVMQ